MKIIDANVCLGGDFVKHPIVNHESFIIMDTVKTADTPAELLQVMDKFQIQQAAAWHRTMFDYDPIKGNEALTWESSHSFNVGVLTLKQVKK